MRHAGGEPVWGPRGNSIYGRELPITSACLGFRLMVGIFRPYPDERRTVCFGGLRAENSRIYHPSEPRGHPLN
jgi:hypothetical protein